MEGLWTTEMLYVVLNLGSSKQGKFLRENAGEVNVIKNFLGKKERVQLYNTLRNLSSSTT